MIAVMEAGNQMTLIRIRRIRWRLHPDELTKVSYGVEQNFGVGQAYSLPVHRAYQPGIPKLSPKPQKTRPP